jgi:hypothetical protein
MKRVIYLLSGPSHAPNLVCSLISLRKYFDGPVTIFTWYESRQIVHRICSDPYLNADYIHREPTYRGHSDTYVDKTRLIQSFENDDDVLFLDADTIINGSLSLLFASIAKYGFVAAQFNDWVSTGKIISGRINTLRAFPEIDKDLISKVTSHTYPSVNSGIFGAKPESPVLPLWYEYTYAARSTFIPDEKTLHVVMPKFTASGEMIVVDGRWNCSPIYQPVGLSDNDVRIWHFHGDSNLRPDNKSERGWEMWKPAFRNAMHYDSGGIRAWAKHANNKWLNKLLETDPDLQVT